MNFVHNIYPSWISKYGVLAPHDLIVVIAKVWAQPLIQGFDEPLATPTEVSQIDLEAIGDICLEASFILIDQANDCCHSFRFHGYLIHSVDVIDDLSWHFSPL